MNNMKKLQTLKLWLMSQSVEYWEDVSDGLCGTMIPLFIPKYGIAVRIGDDDVWYHQLSRFVRPVIIRDKDSESFVVEKVRNTIVRVKAFRAGSKERRRAKARRNVSSRILSRREYRHRRALRFRTMLSTDKKVLMKTGRVARRTKKQ